MDLEALADGPEPHLVGGRADALSNIGLVANGDVSLQHAQLESAMKGLDGRTDKLH